MSVLTILRWPDPRLMQVCAPVTGDVATLAADMLDTMYAAPGRGLAAPQVGVLLRLCVMDTGWKDGAPDPLVCVNPVLENAADERVSCEEGCLSIPGLTLLIDRPAAVTLRWTDLRGGGHTRRLTGFAAACAQHEVDHLDGIVTFDRIDPATRDAAIAAYSSPFT